jgi:hypothetical protein
VGVAVLTLMKLRDPEYLLSQVALGIIEDYYMGSGEAPGVWHGRWADQLGLNAPTALTWPSTRTLHEWAKAAGSIYQEELRRRLTERLGVAWGPDRNGTREMVGLSDEQLRTFSKRTVAIEEYLGPLASEPADPATRMRAAAASLATRLPKDHSLTPEVLRERWEAEAAEVDLPTRTGLAAQVCGRALLRAEVTMDEILAHLLDPEDGLCARSARFGDAHAVEAVAALGAGRLDVERITELSAAFLASGHAVRLVGRSPRTAAAHPSGRPPPTWLWRERCWRASTNWPPPTSPGSTRCRRAGAGSRGGRPRRGSGRCRAGAVHPRAGAAGARRPRRLRQRPPPSTRSGGQPRRRAPRPRTGHHQPGGG